MLVFTHADRNARPVPGAMHATCGAMARFCSGKSPERICFEVLAFWFSIYARTYACTLPAIRADIPI